MRLWTKVYFYLNRVFGKPQKVEPGIYDRTDDIFTHRTIPFLEQHQDIFSGKVLVVGCGNGVEIDWIAKHCEAVVAVDVSSKAVSDTKKRTSGLKQVKCFLLDDKIPALDNSFDVIFMHNVCEHIIDINFWFSEYYRVLKKDGVFLNQFSPLFYSPFGAHLIDVLKMPWGHLIFGAKAVVELRNIYYPEQINAQSWAELRP